jgi:nucleotide-binding universal stress UspA family protein
VSHDYKTLVVQVDNQGGTSARVEVAARLAAQAGGYLIAVYAFEPGQALSHEEKDREAFERDQVQRIAASAGIPCEWFPAAGESAATIMAMGRCADVIVVGQGRPESADEQHGNLNVAQIVLGTGRPALIVPAGAVPATPGTRIVVAWNGTRESARAVADALPLLVKAKTVTVLFGAEPGGKAHTFDSAKVLLASLERHRIKAQLEDLGRHRFDVGEKILGYCAKCDADLLVMGAYGHSRARELALGGVTQTVLDSMTLPVLMSH